MRCPLSFYHRDREWPPIFATEYTNKTLTFDPENESVACMFVVELDRETKKPNWWIWNKTHIGQPERLFRECIFKLNKSENTETWTCTCTTDDCNAYEVYEELTRKRGGNYWWVNW